MGRRFRLLFGFAALGVLLYVGASGQEYWQALSGISWLAVAASVLVITVDRVVMAWKWNLLLAARTRPLPILRATQIYCTSQLYGLVLPATVGADALRVVCTVAEDRPAPDVAASVILERVLGGVATVLVCLAAMLAAGFHLREEPAFLAALAIIAALALAAVLALLISMNRRLYALIHERLLRRYADTRPGEMLRKLHEAYLGYSGKPRLLLVFMVWTVFEVLLGALFFTILLHALGVQVSFVFVLAAFNAAALLARIPISIAGLGVFEAGFTFVLSMEGVPMEAALLAGVLGRVLQLAAWLPWWAAYVLARPDVPRHAEGPVLPRQQ